VDEKLSTLLESLNYRHQILKDELTSIDRMGTIEEEIERAGIKGRMNENDLMVVHIQKMLLDGLNDDD